MRQSDPTKKPDYDYPDRPYTRLELIARNAESWHGDAEAKQRALNVIAAWARGDELPQALVDDVLKERPE